MRLSTIAGEWRLGFDPELRYTPNGKAICTMRAVANDRQRNKATDEWEDVRTTWVNLEVWGPAGENCAESLAKGDLVTVVGRFYIEEWEDKEGAKRQSPKIMVDSIGPSLAFATAKPTRSQRTGPTQQQGQAPAEDPWATGTPATSEVPPF